MKSLHTCFKQWFETSLLNIWIHKRSPYIGQILFSRHPGVISHLIIYQEISLLDISCRDQFLWLIKILDEHIIYFIIYSFNLL